MNIRYYILWCIGCKKEITLKAKDVEITLDLLNDRHEFLSTCTKCGHTISIFKSR